MYIYIYIYIYNCNCPVKRTWIFRLFNRLFYFIKQVVATFPFQKPPKNFPQNTQKPSKNLQKHSQNSPKTSPKLFKNLSKICQKLTKKSKLFLLGKL